MRMPGKFPAISLLVPCGISNRLYSCGSRDRKFSSREKFPAVFPEPGIQSVDAWIRLGLLRLGLRLKPYLASFNLDGILDF